MILYILNRFPNFKYKSLVSYIKFKKEEGFEIFYYEVICISCRKKFKVYEGTLKYKLVKENMKGKYTCEDCGHRIRLEAIKIFFNR